ncbi:MAG: creatininase family protein [Chloroflexi bacterium]|nr:creatininase family protein [Chloroflexota bacterium]
MAGHYLADLSRSHVEALATKAALVVPVAAIEQHGPDLPIGTDTLLCEAITAEAVKLATQQDESIELIRAPSVAYGYSLHHRPFPGVFSLKAGTLLAVLREVGESAAASGFRRVFFLNGHGGNEELVRVAAREVAIAHRVLAGAAAYWTLALPDLRAAGLTDELRIPGHAGDFEASLLHVLDGHERFAAFIAAPKAPRAVDDPATQSTSYFLQRPGEMSLIDGYTERSSKASAELGKRLWNIVTASVASELRRFAHEPLPERRHD